MSGRPFFVVVVGLGYFSRFHVQAWQASPMARLVGLCDADAARLSNASASGDVARNTRLAPLLNETDPDIVDIVAPPVAHAGLIRASLAAGRMIICQKPFCTSVAEARRVMAEARAAGTDIVIHENFRFQPWHRDIQDVLRSGRLGQVYQARFDLRPGDGRGPDAYLDRQPAFQTMPRLLLHETGVHFIDLFRWFFGDIVSVYADIRRLNPSIAGEDDGTMILHHASGVRAVFDGNRLSDHISDNPRRTMGEMTIEGEGGCLTLNGAGAVRFRPFGSDTAQPVAPHHAVDEASFGGGCVAALIGHVLEAMAQGRQPENPAEHYLHVMEATEAAYLSAATGRRITVGEEP